MKMAEFQFLCADRADIDAYRNQSFLYNGSRPILASDKFVFSRP